MGAAFRFAAPSPAPRPCEMLPEIADFGDMVQCASWATITCGLATAGERLVITAGLLFGVAGGTNSLRVVRIGPEATT